MQKTFVSLPCVYRVFIVRSCTPADAPPFRKQCTHPVFHNATSKEVNPDEGDMAKTPTPAAVQENIKLSNVTPLRKRLLYR